MHKIKSKILYVLSKNKLFVEFEINNTIEKKIFILNENNLSKNKLKYIFKTNINKNNYIVIREIKDDVLYGDLYVNNINLKNYNNFIFESPLKNSKINKLDYTFDIMDTIKE